MQAPSWHRQRAHPRDPRCTPCPALAAAEDGVPSPGWVGRGLPGQPVTGARQSPAAGDCSATKCCHLPPGPSLASARGAEGRGAGGGGPRGGPGAQLQCEEGAEEAQPSHTAQAGQAACVGRIWARTVKQRRRGSRTQHPLRLPCAAAIRPWEGSLAVPLLCAAKLNTGQSPSPPCPLPHPHGCTGTSAAPAPARAPQT